MIYFIDEDDIQLRPLRLELELRNMPSELISSADDALRQKDKFGSADFLFIDVMLAADPNEAQSAFGRDETDGYKTTGLLLAKRLLDERPKEIQRNHLILMSHAASPTTRSKIEQFATREKIRFVSKSAFDDPVAFGDAIEAIVKS